MIDLRVGNSLDVLKTLADNSVDSIVTDPPYELGFMGKKWDNTGIAYNVDLWTECLRVLKPGGHLVAFGGTRTYHRMTVAIEDAGFEIRDSVIWMYGSGFPKSLDVSKAIDKQAGAEREILGESPYNARRPNPPVSERYKQAGHKANITAPATPEAQQWHGWGTALKPAHEPAVLARKPLIGTVADNVLTWGVGALNIDGSRVEGSGNDVNARKQKTIKGKSVANEVYNDGWYGSGEGWSASTGRWPANVILDEHAAEALDEQSGYSVSKSGGKSGSNANPMSWHESNVDRPRVGHTDSGGASRFFYIAKASRAEREAGLEGMEVRKVESDFRQGGMANPRDTGNYAHRANHHPTVKPLKLMRYLVRLVTPPGGIVLDPFMGSGSTGCAVVQEGMQFIGIDLNPEYVEIAEKRIAYWKEQNPLNI